MAQSGYIYGNTARQGYELPERREREYERARKQIKEQKRVQNALSMDAPYVIVLTLALVLVLGMCIAYLKVQADITARIKNIEAQEKILEQYIADNDALESRINAGIDLDEIYTIATEELGMVYANKDQVLTYDKTPTEYVRQNDNIAE
ncbi:MAG: cell division protein FtsL [Lachnospiraceae bacterium]|nr:cell division protein FtsL [Lachnospiraceae bacterium]